MDVSVIIPAYKERAYIGQTLESVRHQDFRGSREVILVDNGSTDGTAHAVRKNFPWVTVHEESRRGTNYARECGRCKATGEILAFTDADTRPPRQWLSNGVRFLRQSDAVALTGPYLFYDGMPRHQLFAHLQRWIFFPMTRALVERSGGSLMFGANMFIKADALARVGGIDTRFTFDGDDVAIAVQLASVGRILYRHDILVYTSARTFVRNGMVRTIRRQTTAARRVLGNRGLIPAHT